MYAGRVCSITTDEGEILGLDLVEESDEREDLVLERLEGSHGIATEAGNSDSDSGSKESLTVSGLDPFGRRERR